MKKIESKDLVIGQEYYDIEDLDLEYSTVLRFESKDEYRLYFSYVRGVDCYFTYSFAISFDDQWYQP